MVTAGMVAMGDGEVEDCALERCEDMLDDRLPGNIHPHRLFFRGVQSLGFDVQ